MQQPAYKVEIGLTPNDSDNNRQPFYWILYVYTNAWCNEGAGWARTPELAWEEAYCFFVRYKKNRTL